MDLPLFFLRQGAAGCSTSELLYYNAITSLPLLLGIVWLSGESEQLAPR